MKMKPFKFSTFVQLVQLLFFCMLSLPVLGQENPEKAVREAQKYMSQGEEALEEGDVSSAEAYYRQAISKDPDNASARYNLGNLYYNEEISNEAIQRHSQAGEIAGEKSLKHKSFHNQGNSFMDQKKYPEAIEAYKNALRSNPGDDETRYNLALAKKLWNQEKEGGGQDDSENNEGEQENEQQENQDQQGDQEQDDQGNPQDQEDGDKKDQGQPDENKEGEVEPKEQEQGEGDKKEEQQQPIQQQPQPGQLSPQQVKSLLEAMGNQEKKVQEKMNAEKVQGVPTRSEKDW